MLVVIMLVLLGRCLRGWCLFFFCRCLGFGKFVLLCFVFVCVWWEGPFDIPSSSVQENEDSVGLSVSVCLFIFVFMWVFIAVGEWESCPHFPFEWLMSLMVLLVILPVWVLVVARVPT